MTETGNEKIRIGRAELTDQGKLGPLLLAVYGPTLEKEHEALGRANLPVSSVEDELMAADDFYFSAIDLMDCCFLAHADGKIIAAACVNPYVAELQYVAVLPEYRRKGIATGLVDAVFAEMHRRGLDHLRLNLSMDFADTGAVEFAAKLGFLEVSRSVSLARKVD